MLKKYFIELGSIFKESGKFFVQNFKKYNLPILLLIIAQFVLLFPVLFFNNEIGFINFSIWCKITAILMLGAFFVLFFYMFKKVFDMASEGLSKEKLSNGKIIKSLLALGLFNCTPLLVLLFCYGIVSVFPISVKYVRHIPNIYSYIFYFVMGLSLISFVKWQNKNIFVAILKSVKLFVKKITITTPVFLAFFILASVIVFAIFTPINAIYLYFNNVQNENFASALHAVANLYSLYVFAGLYIGAQVKIVEGADE